LNSIQGDSLSALNPKALPVNLRQTTLRRPAIRLITNSIRNTTNKIFAIPADAAAMPPNPKIAAMIAITRNTHAYQSILNFSSRTEECTLGTLGDCGASEPRLLNQFARDAFVFQQLTEISAILPG